MFREPLVIATGNPHKLEEIGAVLSGLPGFACVSLRDVAPDAPEPAETGATFEANAAIKALAYADLTGRPCLADDSGLEVDALDGAPGVISSHYSTNGRETGLTRVQRDAANNAMLLAELDSVPDPQRSARFRCVIVIAEPGGRITCTAAGAVEGRIGRPPRVPAGQHGFGYDPLFLVGPDHARTGAELLPAEKNAISHRGRALRALAEQLRRSR